jgi:hypothetical protein
MPSYRVVLTTRSGRQRSNSATTAVCSPPLGTVPTSATAGSASRSAAPGAWVSTRRTVCGWRRAQACMDGSSITRSPIPPSRSTTSMSVTVDKHVLLDSAGTLLATSSGWWWPRYPRRPRPPVDAGDHAQLRGSVWSRSAGRLSARGGEAMHRSTVRVRVSVSNRRTAKTGPRTAPGHRDAAAGC